MCGSVPADPAVPKGRRALQEAACRPCAPCACQQPPSLRACGAGTASQNVLWAPLCACNARDWAVPRGCGRHLSRAKSSSLSSCPEPHIPWLHPLAGSCGEPRGSHGQVHFWASLQRLRSRTQFQQKTEVGKGKCT